MTRTFNPESYAKLLAEYQPKIITTEEENEQAMSIDKPLCIYALALTLDHRPNRTANCRGTTCCAPTRVLHLYLLACGKLVEKHSSFSTR